MIGSYEVITRKTYGDGAIHLKNGLLIEKTVMFGEKMRVGYVTHKGLIH